jgi:hypothetical protein
MSKIYCLKNPVLVIQEHSRPIYWFPLIGVSLPGFVYLASTLLLILLIFLYAGAPGHPGECVNHW